MSLDVKSRQSQFCWYKLNEKKGKWKKIGNILTRSQHLFGFRSSSRETTDTSRCRTQNRTSVSRRNCIGELWSPAKISEQFFETNFQRLRLKNVETKLKRVLFQRCNFLIKAVVDISCHISCDSGVQCQAWQGAKIYRVNLVWLL